MNVHIKKLEIEMDLGNKGLTLGVSDTKDKHIGNLQIGKAKVIWYKGKSPKKYEATWEELSAWLESRG